MAKQKVEVEVENETYELGLAVVGLVKAVKDVVADGKVDVAEIVAAVIGQVDPLVKAVKGIEELPAEAKEDFAAFAKALALPLADVPALFLKKA